ncbi:MAG: spore coat associated protein CotJA [Clostridiales bacterium]|nr:spore coat associated protein CotJA [Clostridiales bacterium]
MEINEIMSEQYGIPKFPEKTSEAMAYVPFQQYNPATYSPVQGFTSGTMFPSLNKVFYGRKCGGGCD